MQTNDRNRTVVAIGMFDSPHFAKWLSLFANENLKIALFPSSPHRRVHAQIKELVRGSHSGKAVFVLPAFINSLALPLWLVDKVLRTKFRSFLLANWLRQMRPTYAHALEIQGAGYLLLEAVKRLEERDFRIILTNYGSDIFWFSRYKEHREKLVEVLRVTDFYACECERDVGLALELGFKGHLLPVQPNAGFFTGTMLAEPLISAESRNLVMVKGYHGWVGRARIVIQALADAPERFKGLDFVFYSCNWTTWFGAHLLAIRTGLRVKAFRKKRLTHDHILDLFSNARVYVGISLSDGISTSLLEAMACGAIPVQTSTACCDEWFTDTGVRVDTISPEAVADAILAALELAKDPSNAERNRQTIREKASEEKVKAAALQYYGELLKDEDKNS